MSSAASVSPMPASEKVSAVAAPPTPVAKPSVRSDEPLIVKACARALPVAQNMAAYPTRTRVSQTTGRASRLTGA